eukprot:comp4998_c1_seq1/m.1090 comp4998_c1_seq1/g.1090  ORF comp4998_c1_seq1/g.1090 comp4998_c1_seq1/m.1090 type:complete len:204 (-) comp4998_c1_seq1:164-775(-)
MSVKSCRAVQPGNPSSWCRGCKNKKRCEVLAQHDPNRAFVRRGKPEPIPPEADIEKDVTFITASLPSTLPDINPASVFESFRQLRDTGLEKEQQLAVTAPGSTFAEYMLENPIAVNDLWPHLDTQTRTRLMRLLPAAESLSPTQVAALQARHPTGSRAPIEGDGQVWLRGEAFTNSHIKSAARRWAENVEGGVFVPQEGEVGS